MKKTTSSHDFALEKQRIAARSNRLYFLGVIFLLAIVILFRPNDAEKIISLIFTASGGFGLAQFVGLLRS